MKIVKTDIELKLALRYREKSILVTNGLAEEIIDKFYTDDPTIYGAISGAVLLTEPMMKLYFGSVDLFNCMMTIKSEYTLFLNEDKDQVILTLREPDLTI